MSSRPPTTWEVKIAWLLLILGAVAWLITENWKWGVAGVLAMVATIVLTAPLRKRLDR